MLSSVHNCKTVLELNQARYDLINQLFKRGITFEEFDLGYENLYEQSKSVGLKWHKEFKSYGPTNVDGLRQLLLSIKYARFVSQFNQAYEKFDTEFKAGIMPIEHYQMCWTLLKSKADFQGYDFNKYTSKFYESK